MNDQSRDALEQLARDLRSARRVSGHGIWEPGPSAFRDAVDVRAWFDAERDRILIVLQEADATVAATLLADVWPVVPSETDDAWCRRLYDVGIDLVARLPTSPALATALRRGAAALRARDCHRLAVATGIHELAIHRARDDDPDATAAALADLATTYRAQGLLHDVVDCLDEALEVYTRHDRPTGIARTLTDLGAVMLDAGRADSAVDHLGRADQVFARVSDAPRHSECLALLGRAQWLAGDPSAADRAFNRALASLIGMHHADARRVRDLVVRLRAPSTDATTGDPPQDGQAEDL